MKIITKHSGTEWLRRNGIDKISEFGEQVADLIGHLFKGIYHVDAEALRTNWSGDGHIKFSYSGELATWDYDQLTELVVLAHDACIRVSVRPFGPKNILLIFHPRKREGQFTESHPTIESHTEKIRIGYQIEFLV